MGLGIRVFFIDNDNSLRRISLKRLQVLIDGDDEAEPLPGYAGRLLSMLGIASSRSNTHTNLDGSQTRK